MFRSIFPRLALLTAFAFAQTLPAARAADVSADPTEHAADFIAHDFRFSEGTIFPELRIQYMTRTAT